MAIQVSPYSFLPLVLVRQSHWVLKQTFALKQYAYFTAMLGIERPPDVRAKGPQISEMLWMHRQNVFDAIIAKQLASVPASEKLAARTLAQPYAIKLIVSR